MSDAATVGVEEPITKSEFARRRNVSAPRVSQYIDEGKIDGAALVGKGRDQKIVESIACRQLAERLNPSQRNGINGLATRLDAPAPPSQAPLPPAPEDLTRLQQSPPPAPTAKGDALADQIARERLEQLQRANRRQALEEVAAAGRLTDAAIATQMTGRVAAQMVNLFEGSLPDLATAIASKFQLPQRDVMHMLRAEFRKVRASAAALMRRQAETLPMTVPAEIESEQLADDGADHERRTPGHGSGGEGMGAAAAC